MRPGLLVSVYSMRHDTGIPPRLQPADSVRDVGMSGVWIDVHRRLVSKGRLSLLAGAGVRAGLGEIELMTEDAIFMTTHENRVLMAGANAAMAANLTVAGPLAG